VYTDFANVKFAYTSLRNRNKSQWALSPVSKLKMYGAYINFVYPVMSEWVKTTTLRHSYTA